MEDNLFRSNLVDVVLPSGNTVTIREANGDDEELLSKRGSIRENRHVWIFLSAIIEKDHALGKKPLVDDIGKYPRADAYYLMFKQRLISLGNQVEFDNLCQVNTCKHTTSFELDASEYDRDLSQPEEPLAEGETLNEDIVRRYPQGIKQIIERTLSSGKQIRFNLLTLIGESKILDIPEANQSQSTAIYARDLEMFQGGRWVKVLNLKSFTPKDMKEIRGSIQSNDIGFNPIIQDKCEKCGAPFVVPLLGLDSFFYPAEKS